MSAIAVELVIILLLLVVNGVFAMSEMAIVAARRTRLEHRAEEGDRGARAALDISAHPTAFLSTVQVGITLVGVLAGAFGGAAISRVVAARFAQVGWLAPYAEPAALGVVVAAITYLSLIVGELVPKRIALSNPERVAALVARPMRVVAWVGAPPVRLLTGSTNLVFRGLGIRPSPEQGVTEQDIRAMVEQGAESGAVEPVEHEIVENAFRLGDRQVGAIMTPRPDVRWLDASCPPSELRAQLGELLRDARGSRLVVCEETIEDVLGVVHAEDLLARCLAGEPLDRAGLIAALTQPLYVPASMPAFTLLQQFRTTRSDVAVALDEFGGVQGVVTVDDLVEAVMGDLPERGEPSTSEIVRLPSGGWLVDGDALLEDLAAALDIDLPAPDARGGYHTAGGLVLARLGRIPTPGDTFEYADHRFEVVTMEGRRVGSVRLTTARPSHRGSDRGERHEKRGTWYDQRTRPPVSREPPRAER